MIQNPILKGFCPDPSIIRAGGDYTTEIMTDEHCRGFTGAHFGLYIHDMTGMSACADFDYMSIENYKAKKCGIVSKSKKNEI